METFYDETFDGSELSILCEPTDEPSIGSGEDEDEEEGLSFGILTNLYFHALENIHAAMLLTFHRYSLPTCLDNLLIWYQQALGNEEACYFQDEERQGAIARLYESVRKVMEALYIIYCPENVEYTKNVEGEWSAQYEVPWEKDKPIALTKAEFKRPTFVIERFRHMYCWEYLEMELWDWLSAGITNESDENLFPENRACIMDFYAHIHYMLECVFYLSLPHPYK